MCSHTLAELEKRYSPVLQSWSEVVRCSLTEDQQRWRIDRSDLCGFWERHTQWHWTIEVVSGQRLWWTGSRPCPLGEVGSDCIDVILSHSLTCKSNCSVNCDVHLCYLLLHTAHIVSSMITDTTTTIILLFTDIYIQGKTNCVNFQCHVLIHGCMVPL